MRAIMDRDLDAMHRLRHPDYVVYTALSLLPIRETLARGTSCWSRRFATDRSCKTR